MGTNSPEETWGLIMRLVSTLVRELEPQMLPHIERGLMSMAALITDRTDLEMVVPELILLLGEDSKVLSALKMVKDIGILILFGSVAPRSLVWKRLGQFSYI